jgi:cyclopropane fatty-acyl-phospholipid synthase-like methyltransferase
MNHATDPTIDYKSLVRDGYNRCANAYTAARQESPKHLHLLTDRLTNGSRILDIGCGAGIPITRQLAQDHDITGVDISPVQIELAQRNIPHARFLCADIMTLDFGEAAFDAITSFYAIFHLPREEHAELFTRIRRWLAPGGYLMCTVVTDDEPAYTEDDFFGTTMYWSNFGRDHYRQLLQRLGFEICIDDIIDDVIDSGSEGLPPASHPLLLARKAPR